MKVIAVSNFSDETVSDVLIADNLTKVEADVLVENKNAEYGDSDNAYYNYKSVDDDYKLYIFEP